MVVGVEPLTCGGPAYPSPTSMRMTIAPGGVDVISICPLAALSSGAPEGLGAGCAALELAAFPSPEFVCVLPQARAANKMETRQKKAGSRYKAET